MGSVKRLARSPHSIDWNLGQASASSLKSTQVHEFAREHVRWLRRRWHVRRRLARSVLDCVAAGERAVVVIDLLVTKPQRAHSVPGGCERTLLSRFLLHLHGKTRRELLQERGAAPPEQLLCSFFWQQRPPRPPPRRCGRGGRCENRNEGPCWPSQFTCICAPAVRCNIVSAQEGPRPS